MLRARVLVVDDEPGTVEVVRALLAQDGAEVSSAGDGRAAIDEALSATVTGRGFDVVLLDDHLPSVADGDMIRELGARGVDARVVVMSDGDPPKMAAETMRLGAFDFVAKPLVRDDLRARVERALRDRRMTGRPETGARRPRKSDVLIGTGAWIKQLYERIGMVAATDIAVTITGPSGTGKELVARTIHNLSPRYEHPFVVVSCAALPANLLEDELFGHVKGAFTDATRDRDGLIAQADGGTLFLDEIGEMPVQLQAKLLRVLQFHEYRRIGDDQDRQVDMRVITATHRDLVQMVEAGEFRQDLLYRINVFPLRLPPLRERKEDVPLLAQHFLLLHRARADKRIEGFTPGAIVRLSAEDWPGNVRQLENKIQEALVVAEGPLITAEDLDVHAAHGSETPSPPWIALDLGRPFQDLKHEVIDRFERDYLQALLTAHTGNLAAAARQAGMDRKNLWALAKKHGLELGRFRK
jgi:two-component system response regulator AtoC